MYARRSSASFSSTLGRRAVLRRDRRRWRVHLGTCLRPLSWHRRWRPRRHGHVPPRAAGSGLPLQARAPAGVRPAGRKPDDDRAPTAARHRPVSRRRPCSRTGSSSRATPTSRSSHPRRHPTGSRIGSSRRPTSRLCAAWPRSAGKRQTSPPVSWISRRARHQLRPYRRNSTRIRPARRNISSSTRAFRRSPSRRAPSVNQAVDRADSFSSWGPAPRNRRARSCHSASPATGRTAPTACGRPGRNDHGAQSQSGRSARRASGTFGARVQVWAPADHAAVARYVATVLRRLGYRASPQSSLGTRAGTTTW